MCKERNKMHIQYTERTHFTTLCLGLKGLHTLLRSPSDLALRTYWSSVRQAPRRTDF